LKENEALKRLLASMGLDNDFLKTYIRASEIANQTLKAPNERHDSENSQVEESPGFQVTYILFFSPQLGRF